jgi:hypothetical protein
MGLWWIAHTTNLDIHLNVASGSPFSIPYRRPQQHKDPQIGHDKGGVKSRSAELLH